MIPTSSRGMTTSFYSKWNRPTSPSDDRLYQIRISSQPWYGRCTSSLPTCRVRRNTLDILLSRRRVARSNAVPASARWRKDITRLFLRAVLCLEIQLNNDLMQQLVCRISKTSGDFNVDEFIGEAVRWKRTISCETGNGLKIFPGGLVLSTVFYRDWSGTYQWYYQVKLQDSLYIKLPGFRKYTVSGCDNYLFDWSSRCRRHYAISSLCFVVLSQFIPTMPKIDFRWKVRGMTQTSESPRRWSIR